MSPERWERLLSIYERAVELAPEERAGFLARECVDDPSLLAELERLLKAEVPELPRLAYPETPTQFARELAGREFDDFLLVEEIGRGGMGVVYLANQRSLRRFVALKLLPRAKHDEQALRRFEREAAAAASLDHPHIVPVYASRVEADLAWYAMRYVPGWDLDEELRRQRGRRTGESELPIAWPPFDGADYIAHAVEKVAELADAIAFAHTKGIVHRDVKPHNILLDREGTAYLTDFGLARDERFGTLTNADAIQGTPHYMSPEQAAARPKGVDHRTDVYSLGVVLYEILSLRRPFEGKTSQEILHNITSREAPALLRANPRVPRDLATVVEKAMGKRAEWRYAGAKEFAEDLRRFLRHEAVVARRPSLLERTSRWAERRRVALSVGISLAAALVLGARISTALGEADEQRDLVARIQTFLRLEPRERSAGEAARMRKTVSELEKRSDTLSSELRGEVARASEWFRTELDSELVELPSALQRALGTVDPDEPALRREASATDFALWLGRASEAAIIHEHPELLALATPEAAWPRLTLRSHPALQEPAGLSDARVFLRPIDDYESQHLDPIELGRWPVVERRVPPGLYFIVVEIEGYGFAELARYLESRDEPYTFDVPIRRTEDVLDPERMKALAACELELNRRLPSKLGCPCGGESVAVREFHVDLAETSNAEYERFLRESASAAPRSWTELGYSLDGAHSAEWTRLLGAAVARWGDLPVVGLSWEEACLFAEWQGKALPLHHECERYMRGCGGWYAPNQPANAEVGPITAEGSGLLCIGKANRATSGLFADAYGDYLRNALPVREPGYLQLPEGLFHVYGNVWEFTASRLVEVQSGVLVVGRHRILQLGMDWSGVQSSPGDGGDFRDLTSHRHWGMGDEYRQANVGIRCIKRVQP